MIIAGRGIDESNQNRFSALREIGCAQLSWSAEKMRYRSRSSPCTKARAQTLAIKLALIENRSILRSFQEPENVILFRNCDL